MQKDIDDWKERERQKFVEKFGREPRFDELPRYEHLMSLDAFLEQDDCGDSCNVLAEELLRQQIPISPEVEHLREIVAKFPAAWQEIYWLVIIAGMPVAHMAKRRKVTEGAIRKTVKKIYARIKSDENLKKIFHGGTDSIQNF